jgi:hypothetical protein
MTKQRKRIVMGVLIIGVVLALMLTMHILANNVDLFALVRSIHGG